MGVPNQSLDTRESAAKIPDDADQTALDSPKGHFAQIELMNNSAVLPAPSAKRSEEEGRNHTPLTV
jgi:hypothetical protein